jgi:hypothetical protein
MAVVINEVEVVDTPGASEPRGQGDSQTSHAMLPQDEELRRVLAEVREHDLRTWSH